MKVVWENFKTIISFRIIAIIASILPVALIPICFKIFNLTLPKKKHDMTLGEGLLILVLFAFIFSISFFSEIKLPDLSLRKLFKLNSLLKYGIYTEAKIIDIQETKKYTTFYLKLMHPEYKHEIIEYKIPCWKYHKRDKSAKILSEVPIYKKSSKRSQNVSIVTPQTREDNINDFNEYHYLTINSVVPILYNPYKKNNWMLCPLWDVWRRNHWLDDYVQDSIETEENYKQRIISHANLFQNKLSFKKYIIILALIILAISLLHNGFFIIVAITECWLFLMYFVWANFYFPRHHDFYEYSVATMGIITSANEITEQNGKSKYKFWIYNYTFTTPNRIPYQGQVKVPPTSDMMPYEKKSHATVLYDPYCIAQNCLAFYYPYSWIQPKETEKLYPINIVQPDDMKMEDEY